MWDKYLIEKFSFIKRLLKKNASEVWYMELPNFIGETKIKANLNINDSISLYIHVPFCYQKCSYCEEHGENNIYNFGSNRYVNLLIKELHIFLKNNNYKKKTISSLSMGGGTPTLLDGKDILLLMNEIKKYFILDKKIQVTIETVPNKINLNLAKYIKKAGFNRVSIGVQSFNENTLKKVGRFQKNQNVYTAFNILRKVGFEKIVIDLIVGLDNELEEDFIEESINHIIKLKPYGISLFSLQSTTKDKLYNLSFIKKIFKQKISLNNNNDYTYDRRIEQKNLLGIGCGANGQGNLDNGFFYTYKKVSKNLFIYEKMIQKNVILYRYNIYNYNLQLKKLIIRGLVNGFSINEIKKNIPESVKKFNEIIKKINFFIIKKGNYIKINKKEINNIEIGNSFEEKYFVFWFLYILDEKEKIKFKKEIINIEKNIL